MNNDKIGEVEWFKYLGSYLQKNNDWGRYKVWLDKVERRVR